MANNQAPHPRPARPAFNLILALLWLTPGFAAYGQESRGTIIGRVSDASGAILPGVTVRATNVATGVQATAKTNDAGSYNIPFLTPGTYRITAEVGGFKRFIQDDVEVRVSETVDLSIAMEVGAVSESVETRSEATRMPIAIANPISRVLRSLFSISELNEAASTSPAAAIAGATARTARAVASRCDPPFPSSSRSRADIRML